MAFDSIWRHFVAFVNGAGRTAPLPQGAKGLAATELEADADFSEEFGYERGFAGGSGFENVEFDTWV